MYDQSHQVSSNDEVIDVNMLFCLKSVKGEDGDDVIMMFKVKKSKFYLLHSYHVCVFIWFLFAIKNCNLFRY